MMKLSKHLLLPAAVFMLALGSARVSAQTAGQFQDFTLVLETPRTQYLELQTIPLVMTFKNDTKTPLTGHTVLEFGASFMRLYIDRPDGPQEIPVSMMIRDVFAVPHVFQPGEQIKRTTALNYRLDNVFPNPGTYRLHVRLRSLDGKDTIDRAFIDSVLARPKSADRREANAKKG